MRPWMVTTLAALAVLLLALPLPAPPSLGADGNDGAARQTADAVKAMTVVDYNSSVDAWNLSFNEWLPASYDSTLSYPLAVYLHPEAGNNSTWYVGGAKQWTLASQSFGASYITAARSLGFILIAINTRTLAGFYVNSPFTGPQEQDVLDAIAFEETRRATDGVYVFGDGMGSVGALSLASHYPTQIAGIGAIAPCGDLFEMLQWRLIQASATSIAQALLPTGGQWPNQTDLARGIYYYLSASRFYPQNFSNIHLYYAVGGNDVQCPNNARTFGYLQGNNTVFVPTCTIATRLGEPAKCTNPLANLSGNYPSAYLWRYAYVPLGRHSGALLNASDMMRFWVGLTAGGAVCGATGKPLVPCSRPGDTVGPFTTQYYLSTVDQVLNSYYEWLPTNYARNGHFPTILFLHGKATQGMQIYWEASGQSMLRAALAQGFIVISLNTRNSGGFYVNSPFTGPEEQDVLDAIVHEKQLRPVKSLYIVGMSMGTIGAFSLVAHHKGLAAGLGAIAACTDLYQVQAWKLAVGRESDFTYFLNTTGGYLANQSAYAAAETYYLSSFRFYPTNFSGVRLYVVQGGNDNDCPNNPNIWGYQQVNNTILNSTCLSSIALTEPAQCTTPISSLAAQFPLKYHYRFVYAPTGTHSLNILNGADLIAYFTSQVSDGLYWSNGGGTPYVPPE